MEERRIPLIGDPAPTFVAQTTRGKIHICEVCGHTAEGTAPERCPICQAARDRFKAF